MGGGERGWQAGSARRMYDAQKYRRPDTYSLGFFLCVCRLVGQTKFGVKTPISKTHNESVANSAR